MRKSATAILWILWILLPALQLSAQTTAKVDFARDVQPILKERCYECHGPSQQMRGLRLDRRRDALPNRVGANNARIVPGNSAGSLLYRRLAQNGTQMPPYGLDWIGHIAPEDLPPSRMAVCVVDSGLPVTPDLPPDALLIEVGDGLLVVPLRVHGRDGEELPVVPEGRLGPRLARRAR